MDEGAPGQPAMPVVLLVDDEPLLLDSLVQQLRANYTLFTAGSAAEAGLRLADRRFDVIVCDHTLPGEQGLDFLTRAMESVPSTRRILMTGYTSPEFTAQAMAAANLSACLVKPLRASEISAAIKSALAC